MPKALSTLRVVQWSMLAGILVCVMIAEWLATHTGRIDQTLSYVLTTLAVGVVGTIFVVRRTLVLPAATSLQEHPDDGLSLNHWKTGYMATYALCDALVLFGLVLRFRGSGLEQSLLFYVGGVVLLIFFRARLEANPSNT